MHVQIKMLSTQGARNSDCTSYLQTDLEFFSVDTKETQEFVFCLRIRPQHIKQFQ
jgi:hypothetical protein